MFGGEHDAAAEAVLVAADRAMYQAKEEGRDRIAFFDEPAESERVAQRGQSTTARIRDALTQNRLSLATQPIRSLASGGIERYELLLRMTGDDGELLPAASFIRTAERSGMVQELDRWVVGRALEILAERERAGEPVSLHVNISGVSVTDISVLEFIERRLDEGEADPGRCTFEITQTARVEDYEKAAGFADRLTEFGCEVAIDDYGAGFGPFDYLKQVPFDVIKIDGSFIRDMPRNDADQLTVKAIVQIARGLGKTTIAEFVQDDDTTRMLREYGVDMAQGFHLGRPVDAVDGLTAEAA
jgi:EAL domain-containing protein (putative c-di-GMP-specific phosphodiesterase class I)